jgi:hypothetical protein
VCCKAAPRVAFVISPGGTTPRTPRCRLRRREAGFLRLPRVTALTGGAGFPRLPRAAALTGGAGFPRLPRVAAPTGCGSPGLRCCRHRAGLPRRQPELGPPLLALRFCWGVRWAVGVAAGWPWVHASVLAHLLRERNGGVLRLAAASPRRPGRVTRRAAGRLGFNSGPPPTQRKLISLKFRPPRRRVPRAGRQRLITSEGLCW